VWSGVKLKYNSDDESDFADPEFSEIEEGEVELNEL
jgi:hypothetical protein